ncbi:hypothetical protein [Chryseobacterium sp. AG363]|uniref:hypothetical protein n=1 Tax=Chryseobacterium sp. AG363 TaxID=2183997 RepID=UPI000E746F22|nr:hypothetical protein [Chryseobacterium sp. AG363]RKE81979.1 hypothetical protein DEU39_1529 [Chryseobacterium sp. AG363]
MNEVKLLDEIFKTLTSIGPQPTLSETNKAYSEALSLLKKELNDKYNRGKEDGIKETKENFIKKQQNQN